MKLNPKTKTGSKRLRPRGDTRQALIDGGLSLLDGDKSFDGLSLRELTRAVGVVPTAFYRHFTDMNELGHAMVDEAFQALRQILADMRAESRAGGLPVAKVVKALLKHVSKRRAHFRFIAAERYSGNGEIRQAVRRELRLVQGELATDLARMDMFRDWDPEDLQMAAGVILNHLLAVTDEILEDTGRRTRPRDPMMRLAEQQLRLILLGVSQWRHGGDPSETA